MEWDGNSYTIEELTEDSFGGVDIALFSAGGSISKKFAPIASDAGCTVRHSCRHESCCSMTAKEHSSAVLTLCYVIHVFCPGEVSHGAFIVRGRLVGVKVLYWYKPELLLLCRHTFRLLIVKS